MHFNMSGFGECSRQSDSGVGDGDGNEIKVRVIVEGDK